MNYICLPETFHKATITAEHPAARNSRKRPMTPSCVAGPAPE